MEESIRVAALLGFERRLGWLVWAELCRNG